MRVLLDEFEMTARALAIALTISSAGCGLLPPNHDLDVAPPPSAARVWMAPSSIQRADESASKLADLRVFEANGPQRNGAQPYDLPALIDLALRTNPATQHAWYAAQGANAHLGQSHAANYPQVTFDSKGGYLKLPIQFPGQTLVIRNEAVLPQVKVDYDLLDFGRTRAGERGAREQLIAANFAFNQTIQDVVFNVEKSFYVLSAANASVSAAEANLKLARTSLEAVEQRHQTGLATKPQVLLAKQLVAQGDYDLENSRSMVHDAEAGLRQAVGIAAGSEIKIESDQLDHVPQNLSQDLETLLADALRQRPDIAAQIAAVRASDAAIAGAKAEFYPEVGVGGNYGQVIWSYTVNGGNTQNLNQPFYGAELSLRWNLFTGFDRYYGLQKAIAQRNVARSELRSAQLEVVTTVWKAYYDFVSAQKRREASEALLVASQESFVANLENHRHGLATITDLIGAERDLMGARYALVQSKAEVLISSSALAHAVGTNSSSKMASP